MSLRGAIASLTQGGPYLVARIANGTRVKGHWITGPTATTLADDVAESVDLDANTLSVPAHDYTTGDGPVRFTVSMGGTLPAPLSTGIDYWIVVASADEIQIATSLAHAMAVPPVVVTLTDAGDGTHTIVDTADTLTQNRTTFLMAGSVQPETGAELRDLPEGQRVDEIRVIYTLTELRSRHADNEPDRITLEPSEDPWVVIKVQRFDAFGGTHYRAWAARTERP